MKKFKEEMKQYIESGEELIDNGKYIMLIQMLRDEKITKEEYDTYRDLMISPLACPSLKKEYSYAG